MIYTVQTLKEKYKEYSNILQKIKLEADKGHLIRIKRGLYSDDISSDANVLANYCYGPSYISFEYALYYYGLIPEYVRVITSAAYKKNKYKKYNSKYLCLEYKHVPDAVYPLDICILKNEDGISYRIASKEKALCDQLYSMYCVRSINDLKEMIFDNLRVDEEAFMKLDLKKLSDLASQYHTYTLDTLVKYVNNELLNE